MLAHAITAEAHPSDRFHAIDTSISPSRPFDPPSVILRHGPDLGQYYLFPLFLEYYYLRHAHPLLSFLPSLTMLSP